MANSTGGSMHLAGRKLVLSELIAKGPSSARELAVAIEVADYKNGGHSLNADGNGTGWIEYEAGRRSLFSTLLGGHMNYAAVLAMHKNNGSNGQER